MSSDSKMMKKIAKYSVYLENEDKVRRGLEGLAEIEMTFNLLEETGVGKAVNRLRDDKTYGELAHSIVKKWKKLAMREVEKKNENRKSFDSNDVKKSRKRAAAPHNDFAAMLTMIDSSEATKAPLKKKPRFTIDTADLESLYKPLSSKTSSEKEETSQTTARPSAPPSEEYDPSLFKYKSSDRMRVFAGRKKSPAISFVDSLHNLAMKVLANNIEALQTAHSVPFNILRPVLVKCSTVQLARIEAANPQIEEDSDCLWENHFLKANPGHTRLPNEMWKEAYFRGQREKEERLKMLSKRITSTHRQVTQTNTRKVIMSTPIAPRNVTRKQISNGLKCMSSVVPDALAVSRARKEVFNTGSKTSLQALPSAVKNLNSDLGASRATKKVTPKRGHLMMKTLKMLNMRRR